MICFIYMVSVKVTCLTSLLTINLTFINPALSLIIVISTRINKQTCTQRNINDGRLSREPLATEQYGFCENYLNLGISVQLQFYIMQQIFYVILICNQEFFQKQTLGHKHS